MSGSIPAVGRTGAPAEHSPLQVRAVFRGLGVAPEKVLAGNRVPFRSPSSAELEGKEQALAFGLVLLGRILAKARPGLVIGMGRLTTQCRRCILQTGAEKRIDVGLGACCRNAGRIQRSYVGRVASSVEVSDHWARKVETGFIALVRHGPAGITAAVRASTFMSRRSPRRVRNCEGDVLFPLKR